MKKFVAFLLITVMLFTCVSAAACNKDDNSLKVTLNYCDENNTVREMAYDYRTPLPAPTREGFDFEGWYFDKACTQSFQAGTVMLRSFELYAKWSKADDAKPTAKHTVTFVFNDETTPDSTQNVNDGMPAALPSPTRGGYRFDGWYTDLLCTVQYTMQPITADITLYAKWTKTDVDPTVTHTVTFVYNDGVTQNTTQKVNDGALPTLPNPTRGGYRFDGWYTDLLCTVQYTMQPITADITLYAKWTKTDDTKPTVTHTVTFVYNDGVTQNTTQKVNDGALPTLPNPTRGGYTFDGWYTDLLCTVQYTMQPVTADITLYAKWTENSAPHTTHTFDSYFMYVECSYPGCTVMGRATGSRNYDNKFDFSTTKKNQITSHYNSCNTALKGSVNSFYNAFVTYEEDIGYLDDQYYWAMMYVDADKITANQYNSLANCYDDNFVKYYQLFIAADEAFGTSFWNLYGSDSESVLYWADIYTSSDVGGADSVLQDYDDLMNGYYEPSETKINNLYKQLVNAYNKEASSYGYANYIEYAYKEVYNREYTPSDVAKMRAFVKQYIAPALVAVEDKLDSIGNLSGTNNTFYNDLTAGSIVGSSPNRNALGYIGNYFKWLNGSVDGSKNLDFYSAVNEMFRVGNYFTGSGEGAYTMWIPNDEMAAVYVQKNSSSSGASYDTAFTFVHEFGHYYNNIHNGGAELSYDHDETQSQGDEMLFLAWLKENKPSGVTMGMSKLELQQLSDILWTICMSSAVDELEQAAYTGTYNGRSVTGGYHALFEEILDSYGTEASALLKYNNNVTYWYYVAFDNAVYYISYAMSALPCVELYTVAESDGLTSARDKYFKLYTYCESASRMSNYTYTGTDGVLAFCGLDNPFSETLYQHIGNYVNGL